MEDSIKIRGARANNLKSIDVDIPLKKITCICGPSGSGKSSLAFHTLLAESKRRLINCFPSSLRFFTKTPAAVDVDSLGPVLPAFGLPQVNPIKGSRESVMDSLGLTHLIQGLYYYCSTEVCPKDGTTLKQMDQVAIFEKKFVIDHDSKEIYSFFISKNDYLDSFAGEILPSRVFQDGAVISFDKDAEFWEVFRIRENKFSAKFNKSLESLQGKVRTIFFLKAKEGELQKFNLSDELVCPTCFTPSKIHRTSSIFTPYNAYGACKSCSGFGANLILDPDKLYDRKLSINDGGVFVLQHTRFEHLEVPFLEACKKDKISLTRSIESFEERFWKVFYHGSGSWKGFKKAEAFLESKKYKPGIRILLRRLQKEQHCAVCDGSRVTNQSFNFFVNHENLKSLNSLKISELSTFFEGVTARNRSEKIVLDSCIGVIKTSLGIGLGHLSLKRKTKTLSAGEYQRVLLVKYLSFEGTDSLFVFDEPSIGLDQKQQVSLMKGLQNIKDQGNTVVVVDHSKYMEESADYTIYMGPGAGHLGGDILKQKLEFKRPALKISARKKKKLGPQIKVGTTEVFGKKYSSFEIPTSALIWVNGNTGSGKSSVLKDIFLNELNYRVSKEYLFDRLGTLESLDFEPGLIESTLLVDANINRYTSRSTVGSMSDLSKPMRNYYSKLAPSVAMNLTDGHFSANSASGRCPKCEGRGVEIIEMPYLEDVVLTCEECEGHQVKLEYALISDGKRTFSESMNSPISEVFLEFALTAKYKIILEYFKKLKLDYLSLNRKLTSLSGGEKQRIYLLSKLIQKSNNRLILIENLSFGLSKYELYDVLLFLKELTELGQTIIVIDRSVEIFSELSDWSLNFEDDGKIIHK
jgi:excinuclease ABC subunit A